MELSQDINKILDNIKNCIINITELVSESLVTTTEQAAALEEVASNIFGIQEEIIKI